MSYICIVAIFLQAVAYFFISLVLSFDEQTFLILIEFINVLCDQSPLCLRNLLIQSYKDIHSSSFLVLHLSIYICSKGQSSFFPYDYQVDPTIY